MKSFEVKMSVTGYKNKTKVVFCQAVSKSAVMKCEAVISATHRPDIAPEDCPMVLINDGIINN